MKPNILIDGTGHARLADFGMLTIARDATGVTASNTFEQGGTVRWMSPELFSPDQFNLKDGRPTKQSDCYALGMTIYEVLSGQVPFVGHGNPFVMVKVLKGERPVKPRDTEGRWFTDEIWNVLELCWKHSPGDRPRVEDVFYCLEEVSRSWLPPQMVDDPATVDSSTWSRDPTLLTEGEAGHKAR